MNQIPDPAPHGQAPQHQPAAQSGEPVAARRGPHPGTTPWWTLAAALSALAVGAGLVLAGKATPGEAGAFIAPAFALLGTVRTTGRPDDGPTDPGTH